MYLPRAMSVAKRCVLEKKYMKWITRIAAVHDQGENFVLSSKSCYTRKQIHSVTQFAMQPPENFEITDARRWVFRAF